MRTPRAAIHNPDLLARDDLVAGFVARARLLESIVLDLSRERSSHRLILGQRGMGKTTLLRRLYFAVQETPALVARWMPIVFREEQYNVSRISDFWLNCLDALSDALEERGRAEESAELDAAALGMRDRDEGGRARESLGLLVRWAERQDKKLLLLVDNFDLLLDRLDEDAHWALRELLSEDRALLIGASIAPHPATYEYDRAFYDFFRSERLSGLDERETEEVLLALSELRDTPQVREILRTDPGRVRTLRVLSGGNPRVIVLVHQLLADASERTVVDDVLALLDLSTPLFKARFEQLAPQAQIVFDALALAWDPLPAGELAKRLPLAVNTVSAQLSRLVDDGLVEKVKYPGPRAGYQVAERFFQIWYLVRASRHTRQRLLWLLELLHELYGPAYDRVRARGLARDAGKEAEDAQPFSNEHELGVELRATDLLEGPIDLRVVLLAARRAVLDGEPMRVLSWLDETKTGDRYRPVRDALAAISRGSDHFLTIAPEIREAAQTIAAWLANGTNAAAMLDAPPAAGGKVRHERSRHVRKHSRRKRSLR